MRKEKEARLIKMADTKKLAELNKALLNVSDL
jgi:hypothetical protein